MHQSRGDPAHLPCVPRVLLFDRHHCDKTSTRVEGIDSFDSQHTGPLESFPNREDASRRETGPVLNGRFHRGLAVEDRIVAMVQGLNSNHWPHPFTARVVAGVFSEGSFDSLLFSGRWDLAFNDHLGIGSQGESTSRSHHDWFGLSFDETREFVLRSGPSGPAAGCPKEIRIRRYNHSDGTVLSLRPIFFHHQVSMMVGGYLKTQGRVVMHHDSVGTHVDPSLIRIFGDDCAPGSYIQTAVFLMPFGDGKLLEIDGRSLQDVFHHGG